MQTVVSLVLAARVSNAYHRIMINVKTSLLAVAFWLGAFALPGCCTTGYCGADNLPRTQQLATVYDTVDFVRFTVRHGCWDALYDSLSEATRTRGGPNGEELSRFDFGFVFPRLAYGDLVEDASPELKEVLVRDMVHAGQILNIVVDFPREGMAQVFLLYEPVPLDYLVFPLVNEGTAEQPRWTLGLYEWAKERT